MVLNTLTVSASVTPTVIKTYATHYLNRKPRRQKPTAHISYDEGLNLIRQFLHHASYHTVEEVQAFTQQWVPNPRWVRTEAVTIPDEAISRAANALIAQLGPAGVAQVGGQQWWQWRREGLALRAEWIEMRAEHARRKRSGSACTRVLLYVHGGAYFFGSVDEHRYQLQRHARKLRARVLAPRYRLAPQYPFPCGLLDCLATYLHLLATQDPSTIVLAGDSAGGGMVLSLLVTLRDQGLPLPAGAVLISPWVDLTHSFPSVAQPSAYDYIPSHGFMQRPSMAWPPPNAEEMRDIRRQAKKETKEDEPSVAGLSITIDGKQVEIKDQIQMYATNELISHPLVSPVQQPTLGGLPPLLILTGGGEVLRDEQIYLAHKAADPARYPPSESYLEAHPEARDLITKYKGTDVQLQVWDDLCHVAPTLSFTRPAKYMFRSIAQFSAWALARAQRTSIEITDDDDVSVISTESSTGSDAASDDIAKEKADASGTTNGKSPAPAPSEQVGKAGDPLPPFHKHMIRQRCTRHGAIFPLDAPNKLPGPQLPPSEVCAIKRGPVEKWMAARAEWDVKFASQRRKIHKQRIKEMTEGYLPFPDGDVPPPSALAGRRTERMAREKKLKRSLGLSLWSLWGSSHDEKTLEREEKADQEPETTTVTTATTDKAPLARPTIHSRSRSRAVTDLGQADGADVDENTTAEQLLRRRAEAAAAGLDTGHLSPSFVPLPRSPASPVAPGAAAAAEPALVLPGTNVTLDSPAATRPKADGVAFPFKLGRSLLADGANASTLTLESRNVVTPLAEEGDGKMLGAKGASRAGSTAEAARPGAVRTETVEGDKERPKMERFETAQEAV